MQRIKHENSYAMVQFMTPFVGYLETIIFRPTAEWNFIIGERYQLGLWSFLGVEMTDRLENELLVVYEGNFQFHSTPDHPILHNLFTPIVNHGVNVPEYVTECVPVSASSFPHSIMDFDSKFNAVGLKTMSEPSYKSLSYEA